ncbi:MAG: hypothetical protein R2744_00285 [Bacteroidales bacterium]
MMKQSIKKLSSMATIMVVASIILVSCKPEQIVDPTDRGVNVRDGGAC